MLSQALGQLTGNASTPGFAPEKRSHGSASKLQEKKGVTTIDQVFQGCQSFT